MKFSIKDFYSKCDQVSKKLRIWSHLLKKLLVENFTFCALSITVLRAVYGTIFYFSTTEKLLKISLLCKIGHSLRNGKLPDPSDCPSNCVQLLSPEIIRKKWGNIKKIPETLGFDGKYPTVHKSAVKHSMEKPILLNLVNLSKQFCPRLSEETDFHFRLGPDALILHFLINLVFEKTHFLFKLIFVATQSQKNSLIWWLSKF